MLTPRLTVLATPPHEDVHFLGDRLAEHNARVSGREDGRELAIFLRDEANALCGGLYGWTWAGWLEIRYLWAREDTRGHGHGRELLFAAEQEAKARGCDYALVDTFSFQAPELYRRLGSIEFASLDGFPGQHRRCGVP